MTRFFGIKEEIEVNGNPYTVSIIRHGNGIKTVWFSYVSDGRITLEMCGHPIDQTKACVNPHVYSPAEIMELAICEAYEYIDDLERMEQFDEMLVDFHLKCLQRGQENC